MKINDAIEKAVEKFREVSEGKFIRVISHLDTDGISAAAIISKALRREDRKFSVKIVRQLEAELLKEILKDSFGKNEIFMFLDLGSSSSALEILNNCSNPVFILDHHQFEDITELNENIVYINSRAYNEELSAAGVCYFFAKKMDKENSDSQLAILGMIGDMQDRNISKLNNVIIKDGGDNLKIKRGLMVFSSTRPLHKSLEFSSNIFIPGVTGNPGGVMNLLRELDIRIKKDDQYRTFTDLNEEEMSRLLTAIILKRLDMLSIEDEADEIIGNIYLIKFFNHFEDARELSTLINACSRLGYSETALGFCLGSSADKEKAEEIYTEYRHSLIKALNWANAAKKIESENYIIINAEKNVKDTLIGTIVSIMASSFLYPKGTVIVGMAERDDSKVKVSMRISGNHKETNLRDIISNIAKNLDFEDFGGHEAAAGCLLPKEKADLFIELFRKELEIERIKIKI